MKKGSNYITLLISFVLFLFILALNTALFSLGPKLPTIDFPILLKIALEIIFYLFVLFIFYSERRINTDIWLRSFLLFIFVRILLSFGSAFTFTLIAHTNEFTFSDAFKMALYGNFVIYLFQILVTPFLAYPIVFSYLLALAEKLREEEFSPLWEQEEEQKIFQIPPMDLNPQVIPARIWNQFFDGKSYNDIKTLLRGVHLSEHIKELLSPPAAAEDIAALLKQMVPETAESLGEALPPAEETPTTTPTAVEETVSKLPAEEIKETKPAPPETTPTPAPASPTETPAVAEISELEELLGTTKPEAEPQPPAPPSITEKPPSAPEVISPETLTGVAPEVAQAETPIEVPEIEPVPLEGPETIVPEVAGEETMPIPMELPESLAPEIPSEEAEETAPQPSAPETITPTPSGAYTITSPDDSFKISLRRLIELNKGKQSAQVLERLIKRGANFELAVPMQLLIPQLQQGNAEVSVEYVYSEIPIELVNFMSSDQSGDLSELMLSLPLQEIMNATDPSVIFGETVEQEESKWAKQSADIDIDGVFEDLAEKAADGETELIVEDKGKVLDLTTTAEIPDSISPAETTEKQEQAFPQALLDFARNNGVVPMLENTEKMDVIILQPIGVAGATITPIAQWAATKELMPEWKNTPCYVFVESDMASMGILIAPGMRTYRDALTLILHPEEIPKIKALLTEAHKIIESGDVIVYKHIYDPKIKALLTEAHKALGSESQGKFELEPQEPLPFMDERKIKDVEGYSGAWGKLPGKSIAFISAVSNDPEHWAKAAGAGNALAQMLAGAGKMFAGWQRAIIHTEGWTLAVLPIKGGEMIIEFPAEKAVQEIPQEISKLMETILRV